MNPKLFKSAEFYQRRYHNFATLLIVPLVLLLSFLLIFSLFAQKEVTVTSRGEITPTQVIASIQSTSNNTITTNNLSNNQSVKKDDVVIKYAETMEKSQKQALETQLATLNRQKTGIETLKASLSQGTNLFTGEDEFGYINTFNNFISQSQDIELGISKTNAEINNQLALAGNTATAIEKQINNIYQQIAEYEELSQAITNKSSSLSASNPHKATLNTYLVQSQQQSQQGLDDQYLSQINQSISSLKSSIASLNIQRAGTGIIHLNNEFDGKTLIPNGSEIAQIYPNIQETKEVLITYYVTSEYVPLLKEEQVARLKLEKIGNQNITIIGKIHSIDRTATKTEQGNLFKVTALAQLPDKDSNIIQYGLQGQVTSIIDKKTYFDYYKDKILNNL